MSWCILRMSGPRTLNVVASLRSAGLDVWTPVGMQRRYRPRSTKFIDRAVALLPTFAFARAEHVGQLLAISHEPNGLHLPFTVFQRGEVIPTASDAALEPLREFEKQAGEAWDTFLETKARDEKRKRKKFNARAYVLGQRVHVDKPAFAGLKGEIVEIRNNGDLVLEFEGFVRGTTVSSCDVRPIHLSGSLPEQAQAA